MRVSNELSVLPQPATVGGGGCVWQQPHPACLLGVAGSCVVLETGRPE